MSADTDQSGVVLDEPDPVREQEQFDPERLRPFLEASFPGVKGPVSLLQFRKGHSNLTYFVRFGDREAVLRRAPFGANIKSAHDMGREFTILSGLQGVYPQAPRPIAFCEDEAVIGARFYLMQRVHGVILRNDSPPAGVVFTPELVAAMSAALVDNLATLHAVDVTSGALASIGKPQGYVARQVTGWADRYFKAKTDEIPQLEEAAAWLAGHMPPERGAALIHNDYKYDNVVLDPADLTRVRAVLDWEMATVGDPLMDVGTMLGYWIDPDDPPDMRIRSYGPTVLPGSLSRIGIVERYAERTGLQIGNGLFYYVFALFKISVIGQQIYKRFVDGHTKDQRFASLINWVRVLGRQAARALDRGRIHGLDRRG
jgi:aminoglycoside phosphotransferase (APT) family kinase protein